MSEEEAIDILKNNEVLQALFNIEYEYKIKQAIETILDLYKKEKEKNKELLNSKIGVDLSYDDYVSKDKIKAKIKQTKKVYEDEMKPYQREYGLDVTYLNKKEKAELINKRNCLLTQIVAYKLLLKEE